MISQIKVYINVGKFQKMDAKGQSCASPQSLRTAIYAIRFFWIVNFLKLLEISTNFDNVFGAATWLQDVSNLMLQNNWRTVNLPKLR